MRSRAWSDQCREHEPLLSELWGSCQKCGGCPCACIPDNYPRLELWSLFPSDRETRRESDEESAFFTAIAANALETTLRLVFADWLDEYDRTTEAAVLRDRWALPVSTPFRVLPRGGADHLRPVRVIVNPASFPNLLLDLAGGVMDLFTPIVPPERYHPNFANCMSRRNPYAEALLSKWAEGFVDRDGKFVEEFRKTFNSCFWELYLHAVLKDVGCKIDFSHHAPDFVVIDPVPFVVEATVALNAKDALPEWTSLDLNLRPKDLNEFNRVAMIRLLNSISEKTRKYFKSYQDQPHMKGKPFVLALSPFDQLFFYLQVQRAIEAVLYDYYVNEQEYIDDPTKYDSITARRLRVVQKDNGVELPLGIFNDSSHAHISAVVFNSSATWGKVRALCDDPHPFILFSAARSDPRTGDFYVFRGKKADYQETLYDGLRVYHNPHATHPLDWRIFQEPGALQAVCVNPDTQEWNFWMDRPPLAARNLITFNVPDADVAEMEEMMKMAANLPKAIWHQVPFTPDLVKEIAGMQGKGGDPNLPLSF